MNVTETEKNIILEIYNDPEQGFTSAQNIYKKLDKKITLSKIKYVLDNLEINQIEANKNKEEREHFNIPISQKPGSYQLDISFYDQYKKQNNGYTALLICININTRFVYAYPIK